MGLYSKYYKLLNINLKNRIDTYINNSNRLFFKLYISSLLIDKANKYILIRKIKNSYVDKEIMKSDIKKYFLYTTSYRSYYKIMSKNYTIDQLLQSLSHFSLKIIYNNSIAFNYK